MAGALRTEGYRVLEARNGREGVAVYYKHGSEIDLLVTDVRMPYLSGTNLADELRRVRRTLKVLYITGFPDEQTANEHRLVKPFSRDVFLTTVQQILSLPVLR